jgi:hypothetical protein
MAGRRSACFDCSVFLKTFAITPSILSTVALVTVSLTWVDLAQAEIIWRGDFESQGLSQWSGTNHGDCIDLVSDSVLEGDNAARIEINDHEGHIWSNGLNRVEFRYEPGAPATAEGEDLYFGWSFMLPELFTEDNHQIGYFESSDTWQQMMSFVVEGSTLSFVTRRPQNVQHWTTRDLEAGVWYDLAMHIRWSKDKNEGFVSVWFDGEKVVVERHAQTLNDDNAHFIQLGILRDTITTDESMYVDNARRGTSIDDVLLARIPAPGEPPVGGTGPGGEGGSDDGAIALSEAGCSVGARGARAPFGSFIFLPMLFLRRFVERRFFECRRARNLG